MELSNALLFWSDALQISYNMPHSVANHRLSSAIIDVCSEIQKQIDKEERDKWYAKAKLWKPATEEDGKGDS